MKQIIFHGKDWSLHLEASGCQYLFNTNAKLEWSLLNLVWLIHRYNIKHSLAIELLFHTLFIGNWSIRSCNPCSFTRIIICPIVFSPSFFFDNPSPQWAQSFSWGLDFRDANISALSTFSTNFPIGRVKDLLPCFFKV